MPHPFVEDELLDTRNFYNKSGGMTCDMLFEVIKTCWMLVLEEVTTGCVARASERLIPRQVKMTSPDRRTT